MIVRFLDYATGVLNDALLNNRRWLEVSFVLGVLFVPWFVGAFFILTLPMWRWMP